MGTTRQAGLNTHSSGKGQLSIPRPGAECLAWLIFIDKSHKKHPQAKQRKELGTEEFESLKKVQTTSV